jgi:L-amino acid N-acyltransferase YncA
LIESSEKEGIWTLQAGIFPENKSSIALHKKKGFRVVGVRERIGKMNGVWRDVILLERRSESI